MEEKIETSSFRELGEERVFLFRVRVRWRSCAIPSAKHLCSCALVRAKGTNSRIQLKEAAGKWEVEEKIGKKEGGVMEGAQATAREREGAQKEMRPRRREKGEERRQIR